MDDWNPKHDYDNFEFQYSVAPLIGRFRALAVERGMLDSWGPHLKALVVRYIKQTLGPAPRVAQWQCQCKRCEAVRAFLATEHTTSVVLTSVSSSEREHIKEYLGLHPPGLASCTAVKKPEGGFRVRSSGLSDFRVLIPARR